MQNPFPPTERGFFYGTKGIPDKGQGMPSLICMAGSGSDVDGHADNPRPGMGSDRRANLRQERLATT
jgi:hypothetical protein